MSESLLMLVTAGLEPWVAASLFAVSFITSFITIALGIGGGSLLLAVMATLVPPTALIPVHGLIQLGSCVFRAGLLAGHIFWAPFAAFAVGSVIGVAIGGLIVVDLPPAVVTTGVGLFVIFSVLFTAPAWLSRHGLLTGLVSSFLTMFFGATGLFVAAFSKAQGLERQGYVATHATLMTLQHLLKVITFAILGFAFGPWLLFTVLMMVFGLLGTLAGRLVLVRMSENVFKRLLDVVLILISLRLIWTGVTDLLAG